MCSERRAPCAAHIAYSECDGYMWTSARHTQAAHHLAVKGHTGLGTMRVNRHDTVDRPEPSRPWRSVLATFAVVAPIVAAGGCSEGYDIPPLNIPCPTDGTSCPLGMSCMPST